MITALPFRTAGYGFIRPSKSLQDKIASMMKGKAERNSVDNLFKEAGIYVGLQEDTVDTILADEAHRLSEKPALTRS